MQKLRLGGVPEHFNYPWNLAIEGKEFTSLDLELHWKSVPEGSGKMASKLADGSLDAALMLTEGAVAAIAGGLEARIMGLFVESPLRWGIHVGAKSVIQSVSDLQSKTLAISREGSGSHLMSYLLAEREGWPTGALSFQAVGAIDKLVEAVNEDPSAAFLWERTMTQPLVDEGQLRRIGEIPTPWPCFVLVLREDLMNSHGTVLRKALRIALRQANAFHRDPKAAEILSEKYGLTLADATAWLGTVKWPTEPPVDPFMLQEVGETLVRVGRLETAPDPADLIA